MNQMVNELNANNIVRAKLGPFLVLFFGFVYMD